MATSGKSGAQSLRFSRKGDVLNKGRLTSPFLAAQKVNEFLAPVIH
jgi:hypothetical protein